MDIRLTACSFDIGQAEVDTEWDRESQPERRSGSRGRGADVWRLTSGSVRPLTPPGRVCVRTVWRQLLSSMGAAEAV